MLESIEELDWLVLRVGTVDIDASVGCSLSWHCAVAPVPWMVLVEDDLGSENLREVALFHEGMVIGCELLVGGSGRHCTWRYVQMPIFK